MRILYIVTAFPRWPGDVITPWLIETIRRLEDRGIEVEVLAPSYRGLGAQQLDGTKVHRFRYAPAALERLTHDQTVPDRLRERPWYLALVPGYMIGGSVAAARLSRRGGFDVVHAFWPLPHGLFGLAARAAAGTPLVSTFFGVELTWLRRQLPFLTSVVRGIVRRSDRVTVISSHTEREVRRLVPDARPVTIPFGATVSLQAGPASAEVSPAVPGAEPGMSEGPGGEPGARGGGRPEAFRLLFVGRLVERKGVAVLLRALARLLEVHEVELTVVGTGPLMEPLKAEAEQLGVSAAVRFTGSVSDAELSAEFGRCDLFVLPAVEDSKGDVEGLGVVLIEALQHDRPVVASDSGGIGDIVIDGVTGLLVPPGDVGALAAAIERLMRDEGLRRRLRSDGRRHVERRFSWDRITTDLVQLYQEVVDERRWLEGQETRRRVQRESD